jgi:apolipoprotein N-acyltransferase
VVRAVNMGISAVIDPQGRVIALPAAEWEQSKGVEAVVSAVVPVDRRAALYPQVGDGLVAVLAGSWLAALVLLRRRGEEGT